MEKYLYLEVCSSVYYGDSLTFTNFETKGEQEIDFWDDSTLGYFPFYDLESAIGSIHKIIELKREKDLEFELSRAKLQDFLKCLEDKNLGQEMFDNFLTNLSFLIENNIIRECLTNDPKYCSGNYLGLFENGEPTHFLTNPLDFKDKVKEYLVHERYNDKNDEKILKIFSEVSSEELSKEKTKELRKEYLEKIKVKEKEILMAQKQIEEYKNKLNQL